MHFEELVRRTGPARAGLLEELILRESGTLAGKARS